MARSDKLVRSACAKSAQRRCLEMDGWRCLRADRAAHPLEMPPNLHAHLPAPTSSAIEPATLQYPGNVAIQRQNRATRRFLPIR
ncbi:hypothetical protein [Bradyrhizobium septentrionale]|uniref:Uncharacterized protein n=1 Tax=Bradyrhizobium septentrionale TaxID=1404411 RepID=A0A973VWA2_9BRAD|nr:hypothetical protein [Bradyrhizobium septentrionale]UGY19852.1 hypothetical protein HAP48_0021730 [Bradyrhizobium septentrionale]UGY28635.1 hypothetical protein HU675_0018725 [Bradyrhizobium septentrionale]